MDHAKEAAMRLALADKANGDHLDIAQEATLNALSGIGHALLAIYAAQSAGTET